MLDLLRLALAILATWRISASIYYGKEFEQVRYRFTYRTDLEGVPLSWVGRQLSCFWCVSFWVAFPVAAVAWAWWPGLVPFAVSGGVILLAGGGRTLWRKINNG